MQTFWCNNVNDAYRKIMDAAEGRPVTQSRNGPVYDLGPACILYLSPAQRVLFDARRDANPFFHLFEAIWMMAGRRDVAWISQFNGQMRSYSDDGLNFNAAYGYRWRNMRDQVDQLPIVAEMLRNDRDTRRAVLNIWDPGYDLDTGWKDIACNLAVAFKIREGRLDMTVFNRSNDGIWGACGSNVVHFSVLMEWMAAAVGVPMGTYRQVTDSLHFYIDVYHSKLPTDEGEDPYRLGIVSSLPLVQNARDWLDDAEEFCNHGGAGAYLNEWFKQVPVPMLRAWEARQRKESMIPHLQQIQSTDWRMACVNWVQRRMK